MSSNPIVGVVMGSDSDWPVMEAASTALTDFGVEHEVGGTQVGNAGQVISVPHSADTDGYRKAHRSRKPKVPHGAAPDKDTHAVPANDHEVRAQLEFNAAVLAAHGSPIRYGTVADPENQHIAAEILKCTPVLGTGWSIVDGFGAAVDGDFEEAAWELSGGVPGVRAAHGVAKVARVAEGAATDVRLVEKTEKVAAKACSFMGSTLVLMGDNIKKPIEDVKAGDEVIATDPKTGEQGVRRVEDVLVHQDLVVDLIVDGEVITTTEDHPFWSIGDQRFERADELGAGEKVLAADGHAITVSNLELQTARQALAYNLSVEGIRTFHVGASEVLVHNDCGPLTTRRFDEFGSRITNAAPAPRWQTDELASHLGYKPTGRVVKGQPVYRDGRSLIVQDGTSHNGGFWKMGQSVDDRRKQTTWSGTYDHLLKYVGK